MNSRNICLELNKKTAFDDKLPLIVLLGPTASGKTALAIKVAKYFDGEIISADSRSIYEGLDIGSAKPSLAERSKIPHWGFDLIKPSQKFSVQDFKQYAESKIRDIRSRSKIPFLVGGSGLYIDALIFDFQFPKKADDELRQKYNEFSLKQLIEYCKLNNIKLPENWKNKRYLINQILRNGKQPVRLSKPIDNCLIFGLKVNKPLLRQRIEQRARQMLNLGVIEEGRRLAENYGWGNEAMTGVAYRLIKQYLDSNLSKEELLDRLAISDWHLAKRQMTWFKRNPYIEWLDPSSAEQKIIQKIKDVLEW